MAPDAAARPTLTLWTIYDNPRDAPGWFVVRGWIIPGPAADQARPHPVARAASTLEAARAMLPPGLYCLPRRPGDDPVIVESWL